jgi:predicted nucleotidyltransferase
MSFAAGANWNPIDLVGMRSELAALLGREVDRVEQEALKNPFRRAAILSCRHVPPNRL